MMVSTKPFAATWAKDLFYMHARSVVVCGKSMREEVRQSYRVMLIKASVMNWCDGDTVKIYSRTMCVCVMVSFAAMCGLSVTSSVLPR